MQRTVRRLESVHLMRASAARLRLIAAKEPLISADLLKMADEMDEDAAYLERSFENKPRSPANDDGIDAA